MRDIVNALEDGAAEMGLHIVRALWQCIKLCRPGRMVEGGTHAMATCGWASWQVTCRASVFQASCPGPQSPSQAHTAPAETLAW